MYKNDILCSEPYGYSSHSKITPWMFPLAETGPPYSYVYWNRGRFRFEWSSLRENSVRLSILIKMSARRKIKTSPAAPVYYSLEHPLSGFNSSTNHFLKFGSFWYYFEVRFTFSDVFCCPGKVPELSGMPRDLKQLL